MTERREGISSCFNSEDYNLKLADIYSKFFIVPLYFAIVFKL